MPSESQSTINERLKFLIGRLGMSIRGFSTALGVSDTNTRNYIDRGSKPNSEYLEKLLRRFNDINPAWLLIGEGEPFLPGTTNATTSNVAHIKKNTGIAINTGTATGSLTLEESQRNLADALKENEHLRQQIELKDALLAAKEEMLVLLRGSRDRPN